jgi:protein-S-isoprenylcysteine O-methyltransferase Ste14
MSTTPEPHARVTGSGGCPVHVRGPAATADNKAQHIVTVLYGVVSYVLFLAVFLYLVGFVTDVAVPRSIDRAGEAPLGRAVVIDIGLLTLFALQHTVMARPGFKRWWTRFVPAPIERSTYMLLAGAALVLMFWQWRAIDTVVWHVESVPAPAIVYALAGVGWLTVLAATFMIDHFDLFGIRQVLDAWRSKPRDEAGFREVLLYRVVRHPLLLGFLIAFWATPTMTAGHLLFAVAMTVYIVIAVRFEERDLVDALGEPYRRYQDRVPKLMPRLCLRRRKLNSHWT